MSFQQQQHTPTTSAVAASHTKQPNNYNSHIISSTDKVSQQKNPVLNVSPSISIFFFPLLLLLLLPMSFWEKQNRKIVHKIPIPFYQRATTPTHSLTHSFINSFSQSPNFHPFPHRIVDQLTLPERYTTFCRPHPRHTYQDVTLERTRKKMTKKGNSDISPEWSWLEGCDLSEAREEN